LVHHSTIPKIVEKVADEKKEFTRYPLARRTPSSFNLCELAPEKSLQIESQQQIPARIVLSVVQFFHRVTALHQAETD
jgi:hypothetical protein